MQQRGARSGSEMNRRRAPVDIRLSVAVAAYGECMPLPANHYWFSGGRALLIVVRLTAAYVSNSI